MYSFKNDYSEWCHPSILEKLLATNNEQLPWYGEDVYCEEAKKVMKHHFQTEDVDIYFVSWWTQANAIVIASMLKPFESVISAHTWHINVHEAWAIEATWHKVESVYTEDWKLTSDHIAWVLAWFEDHHMVRPRMVYISNATEVGTVYTKDELVSLYTYCQNHNLYLFLDWARLWSALCGSDLSLSDIVQYTDVFYIWWTKNWALLWEAICITHNDLKADFLFYIKQRWWLLAKWRLLGIQFLTLFESTLFFDLAEHANKMALKLSEWIGVHWYTFLAPSTSNQIFPVLPHAVIRSLHESFSFYIWKKIDEDTSAIRLVTSRATDEIQVDAFLKKLNDIS